MFEPHDLSPTLSRYMYMHMLHMDMYGMLSCEHEVDELLNVAHARPRAASASPAAARRFGRLCAAAGAAKKKNLAIP